MKKSVIMAVATLLFKASIFAYNPPSGGQNVLRISSPELLTGAKSTAGGALLNVTPDSIINNPALPGFSQISSVGVAGSLLLDNKDESDKSIGGAFEIGATIANRWCSPTFLFQGIFVPYYDMHLGNSANFTVGYAKDITEKLAVGLSLNVGLFWGYDSDWTASAALGAYYNYGDLGFLKDFRFGFALTNLGKMYSNAEVLGIKDDYAKMWPGIATLRTGIATTLLKKENFQMGLSLDVATPTFQNFVFDTGLQMQFFEIAKFSTAWEFDLQEFNNDSKNLLPSVSLSFNIKIKSNNEALVKPSAAYQKMYKNVNVVSAGAVLDLGIKDTDPPEITMW